MINSRTTERLVDQLIRHEGVRLTPYQCPAGAWTIGIGRNLESKGLSLEEALKLSRRRMPPDEIFSLIAEGIPRKMAVSFLERGVQGRLAIAFVEGGISRSEAVEFCRRDVRDAEHGLANVLMGFDISYREIAGPRYEALVNVCFNMGAASLRGFRKMFRAIRAGDFNEAAVQLLDSKYSRDVGSRAVELSDQLKTGDYMRS